MPTESFQATRGRVETYFADTALAKWTELTSDAPVSRIRETVRQGRDAMRALLVGWLPADLHGARLLDAGCGPGQLSFAAAERGAEVLGVDVSSGLIDVARQRAAALRPQARSLLRFEPGDMLCPSHGGFDFAVSMDVLIHYRLADALDALAALSPRVGAKLLFTVAPRTPALSVMHAAGKLFPRDDRSPAIQPVSPRRLIRRIGADPRLRDWRVGRTERVSRGFYMSQAVELVRR